MNYLLNSKFLILFFLIPFAWIYIIQKSRIKMLTISIPTVFFYFCMVWQYAGFFFLYFDIESFSTFSISEKAEFWEIYLWSIYSISTIFLGVWLGSKIIGPYKFHNLYLQLNHNNKNEIKILCLVLLVSIIVFLVYLVKIGFENIAFFNVINLTEKQSSIGELRSSMTNAFDGKYHRYHLFMKDFLTISTLALYGKWLLKKKTYKTPFYFLWRHFLQFSAR